MANVLANIFGSSPVQPLEQHIGIAFSCAKQLNGFFKAVVDEDWEKAAAARDAIEQLEHEADDVKKAIRLRLPKSLFMPVPREDLLELLLVQDKIANRTQGRIRHHHRPQHADTSACGRTVSRVRRTKR